MSSRSASLTDEDIAALRRHGFAVAYRMLGSVAEAEDIVQEALLRLTRAPAEREIAEPAAWITTVVTRLAIDHLRLARVQRESYIGPWIPEPVITDSAPGPGAQIELASRSRRRSWWCWSSSRRSSGRRFAARGVRL